MSLRGNIGRVMSGTMLSRILGLVREMLQSRLIGAGMEQSAFSFAFCIPNLTRRLFGEGALTAAFLPVFKGEIEEARWASAQRLARAVSSMVFLLLGAATLLVMLGITGFLEAAEPGTRVGLTLSLTRTMLPYGVLICGAAFGMGILNALNRWNAASFTPCLLNLVWIAGLGLVAFLPGLDAAARVRILSGAILLAGALQLAFMVWCVRRAKRVDGQGVTLALTLQGWRDPLTRRVWHKTFQGAIGAGANQLCTFADQILAQLASPWAAGVIGYADRLMELPLGVVGVSVGTVLLPTLSGAFRRKETGEAQRIFLKATGDMLFIMIPAAVGLAVLAPDITRVVYQGRAFDELATLRVSRALICYAPGLVLFGLNKALTPWFHAQQDIRTPMLVTLWMVGANLVLNVLAVFCLPVEWRHAGIASSTVLCALFTCVSLLILARRGGYFPSLRALGRKVLAMTLAAGVMGTVLLLTAPVLRVAAVPSFLTVDFLRHVWTLGLQVVLGAALYFLTVIPLLRGGGRGTPAGSAGRGGGAANSAGWR